MTDPNVTFSSLQLAAPVLAALAEEGYVNPTPIQAKTIPTALAGRDVLGCAQTGTGKTAAFALPILHRLITQPRDKSYRGRPLSRALILAPTRELATQIAESFKTYGRHSGVSGTTIYGGVGQGPQVRDLTRGVDVIVATPGRLLDLMEQGHVDLSGIETFVLDEADRMLDMGFIAPIREIAAKVPAKRQTLLFSATMPKEIQHLAESLLTDPVRVAVSPVSSMAPKIEQRLYHVPRTQKFALLVHQLAAEKAERAVVFSKTKHGADKLCKRLVQMGVTATAIHGNKAQNQRDRALGAFKQGRARVLVATDVAARGLDVDNISHVFNYDLPMEPEAYVHRIGRTGRAGASGIAISFCDSEEKDLLRQIERLTRKSIPTAPLPRDMDLSVSLKAPMGDDAESHDREMRHQPRQDPRDARRERREQRAHHNTPHQNAPHLNTPTQSSPQQGGSSRASAFMEPLTPPHHPDHPMNRAKRATRPIERVEAAEFPFAGKGGSHARPHTHGSKPARPHGLGKGGEPIGRRGQSGAPKGAPNGGPNKGKPKWAQGGKKSLRKP